MPDHSTNRSSFDREGVRRKYAEERARRVVADRTAVHDLLHDEGYERYLDDPFTPRIERAPVSDEVDVAIIGAGIAGVVTAAKLREAGDFRIRLIDTAGGVGGTWYWNRYPGVMCDTESYIYMPMLEERNYIPSQKYAFGEEIRQHIDAIARKYELIDDALFHTRVEESRWDDDAHCWTLTTDRGDHVRARFVVMAVGILNLVRVPVIKGMERFRGVSFHCSRWDYEYTGGAPGDPRLAKLADKAVALVGNGASGIQALPALAESAKQVYVFQRTPSAIGVRANAPTADDFAANLAPGWQKDRMENFTAVLAGRERDRDLVADGWTAHMAKVANPLFEPGMTPSDMAEAAEAVDYAVMEEHRARIDELVRDPAVAEALKPYYRYLCKRPLFHDEYLPMFNRPNVTLVDCPAGIEEITEVGLVVNGREYEVDCIVYATGFEAEVTPFPTRAAHPIVGRDGVTLAEKWKDGAMTLHGMMTHGFPNLFISPGPGQQSGISVNHTHIMVTGAEHIAATIAKLDRMGALVADVTEDAEAAWVHEIESWFIDGSDFIATCTPSRLNFFGDPSAQNPRNGAYGSGYGDYFGWRDIIDRWRDEDFPGLAIERANR